MKKFTKILVCLMLCFVPFALMACNNDNITFGYDSDAVVYGNGGLAVTKGDYIYFVNGYKSLEDDITDDNRHDSYSVGSLMVAVLKDGQLQLDDDGYLQDEYSRTMTDTLVGYEITDLYIVGDYLYFATPVIEAAADSSGDFTWDKTMVDIARVHLGKPGNIERVYRVGVDYENVEYHCYNVDGRAYIMVYEQSDDGDTLIRFDVNSRESTRIEDVTSVAFGENEVCYVQNDNETGSYNLYRYNMSNGESTAVNGYDQTSEITLVKVVDGYIYATVSVSGKTQLIYHNGTTFNTIYGDISNANNYYISDNNEYVVFVTYGDASTTYNRLEYIELNNPSANLSVLYTDTDASATISIIGEDNGSIIYTYTADSNVTIKSVSIANKIAGNSVEPVVICDALSGVVSNMFDIDDGYIYYFRTTDNGSTNEYLYRTHLLNKTEELVGKLDESDKPSEEE